MYHTLAFTGACLSAALVAASPLTSASNSPSNESAIPDFTFPPQNLTNYGNNSLFAQWRTKARFRPSSNHIGDPTAFWQDEEGVFHVSGLFSYLRGPNISITSSIGSALTSDFLNFTDVHDYKNASLFTNSISIGPGNNNDPLAVFDGSVIPKGYKGRVSLIYTGVHFLPISWSKPYTEGSEVQTLAYSEDNGATWIKPDIEPVIPGPPEGFNVTGFRDPWVFQAPQFAKLLNDTPETWYLTVSSGIRQVGPRLLLYRQNDTDFTSWEFLGPSVSTPVNTTFSTGNFSGNDGSNYETSNTLFLDEDGENLEDGVNFVTMGAESGRETHSFHYSLWKMGKFVRNPLNESVMLEDHATGVIDWGIGYACTTMPDYKTNRRLAFCWSNDDFNSTISEQVGYRIGSGGVYSIPRELYYKEIEGVVADDLAAENGYWSVATEYLNTTLANDGIALAKAVGNDTVTLATLGCKPAREILAFREHANHAWTESDFDVDVSSVKSNCSGVEYTKEGGVTRAFIPFTQSPHSRRWELQTTISIPETSLRNEEYEDFAAGFTLLHSSASAPSNYSIDDAAMLYRPSNETFMITRDLALGRDNVNTDPEMGKLRLWNISSTDATGNQTFSIQSLNIRAFMDGSFFEVYVNDVLTVSTHLYYWYKDSTRMGFYLQFSDMLVNSTLETGVRFSNVSVWEGVPNVFPHRPTDPAKLIDNGVGFVEPPNNPNLPLAYDGVGAPPLPPVENLPYGIDLSTVE
ncbi:glycoside hydrolase family 32 protein [Aureobasidium subglaciale EXF-2481]|uniref:Glycoside hydrolase family 32 protein n=1 Tax=Aureobasidium subglaciale (strain EXF-2481) TaxID=1043005 RepID=A0A074YS09_AURSE|nr:glycoside hydrolase family 32 protein [Aureobasidium subglaciale EXF-2481]KAI5198737.1 Arabinanase/levansucrase/invertase [Aureobasidium subglaciale]KAI5217438.1 Arabinanase/levansucrase/invertase [Aureobasidium subglaciale]KAI5220992.1 Arabinanase/levansucrase/invertase [Aureobasidium subglaciale]KAI5258521.1 Arabinanase/levansucrase/invertase [Aureobasidium subglaciale]KEQ96897.1 glycoside hydrolase family 32 protein [Aureobasidium subglaciale EXF-2481]